MPPGRLPLAGEITGWKLGNVSPWGEISVQFGPFNATVHVTSRAARQLAIEVLTDQGPHLGYQPPNPQMRESPNDNPMYGFSRRDDGRPEWERRADVRDLAQELQRLRAKHDSDTFAWALQMALDQPIGS